MRSIKRNKKALRLTALFVVLSGLLFSKGEGIQLLPFPSAQPAINAAEMRASFESHYHENVTRSEKRQTPFGLHKQGVDTNADGSGAVRERVPLRSDGSHDESHFYNPEITRFPSQTYRSDLNSRPPPAV